MTVTVVCGDFINHVCSHMIHFLNKHIYNKKYYVESVVEAHN